MPFGINLNDVYEQATQLAETVADAVEDVASDPLGFVSDTAEAVSDGTKQFARNLTKHTVGATTEWLGNSLEDAGIDMPDEFSARAMFGLGLEVLGTAKQNVVEKTESVIGEKNMDVAKAVASKIIDIVADARRFPIAEKAPELINKVAEQLADLPDQFAIEDVAEFAEAVINKIAELTNPVGAVVVAVNTILESKDQMVDAVLKMMTAMFQTQQRVADATMTR